jgi:hypothetical protein
MMTCGHLLEQIRERQEAERDFQNAHVSMMNAITRDDAKVSRAALRAALTKRDAIRVAVKFHGRDHGCATELP